MTGTHPVPNHIRDEWIEAQGTEDGRGVCAAGALPGRSPGIVRQDGQGSTRLTMK